MNGLIYVARNNVRSPVMGAKFDFNIMFDYELHGACVLASANLVTHFTATRSGQKLNTVHKDKDPRRGCAYGAGDCSVKTGSEVQTSTCGAGIGQADMSCGNGRVLGSMAVGRERDVSSGRSAVSPQRRCAGLVYPRVFL